MSAHTKAVRFVRFVRSKGTSGHPKGTKGTKFVLPRAREACVPFGRASSDDGAD
jgi:hypothetical protein